MAHQKILFEQIKSKFPKDPPHFVPQSSAKVAAVELLFLRDPKINLIFTKRSSFVRNHKNEISFPGGSYESEDKDLYQTALRETCEEIHICSYSIEYLGYLHPFTTHYGLEIHPFLGCIAEFTFMQAMPNWEVEEIFTIPLSWFLDEKNQKIEVIQTDKGAIRKVRYFKSYQGHIVWGITADILEELIQVLLK